MKKLLLLSFLLFAFPALADTEWEPDQPARSTQPYPLSYKVDKISPWGSFAIGPFSLNKQYLPASYGNIAIGYNDFSTALTTGAVNNLALGSNSCSSVTSGSQNYCFGNNTGNKINIGVANMLFGSGVGNQITTGSYNVVFDPAPPATSMGAGSTLNLLLGSGTSSFNGNGSAIMGYNAGLHDTGGGQHHVIVGANVGLNNAGNGGAETNIILIGANAATGAILDTATTTSNNVIGIGQGYPGIGDTSVGWGALGANTFDNGDQAAFGFNSLANSNVASAANTAFGYSSCSHVTTGTNNLCLGNSVGSTTITSGTNDILIGTSSAVDTTASGDNYHINIGNLLHYNFTSTAAPTISACGSSPTVDTHGNDKSGTVTVGSGTVTSCTITFASAYNTWDHCRVSFQGNAVGGSYSYTKSAITLTAISLTSAVVDYDCDGY